LICAKAGMVKEAAPNVNREILYGSPRDESLNLMSNFG